MNIIQRLWWSLGRGNRVVPSRWQATIDRDPRKALVDSSKIRLGNRALAVHQRTLIPPQGAALGRPAE